MCIIRNKEQKTVLIWMFVKEILVEFIKFFTSWLDKNIWLPQAHITSDEGDQLYSKYIMYTNVMWFVISIETDILKGYLFKILRKPFNIINKIRFSIRIMYERKLFTIAILSNTFI